MSMLDYHNNSIPEAYGTAFSKGWHDGEEFPLRDRTIVAAKLALIHTELTEAFYDWHQAKREVTDDVMLELSDVAIRTYDLLGSMQVRFFNSNFSSGPGTLAPQDPEFSIQLLDLHSCISDAMEDLRRKDAAFPDAFSSKLLYLLSLLYGTAKAHNQDLRIFVDRKMAYNKLRTHRHGGKLL